VISKLPGRVGGINSVRGTRTAVPGEVRLFRFAAVGFSDSEADKRNGEWMNEKKVQARKT